MRRAQAILVILALLAVPLALSTCIGSCSQAACACCAGDSHSKPMNCGSGMGTYCGMNHHGRSQQLPDFSLAAHQSRTAPLPFATIAAPASSRLAFSDFVPALSSGFGAAPFEPPRS